MPSLDGASGVDVTGIAIRNDNRKMTSKRKSWEVGREDSNYVLLEVSVVRRERRKLKTHLRLPQRNHP